MDNNKLINNINQLFHNKGVKQENRLKLLISLLEKQKKGIIDNAYIDIINILSSLNYESKELIQEMFMLFGNNLTKLNLDQFYTPLTISNFINSLMISTPDKKAIDPSGGTGDLLLYYTGNTTIWDIDSNALELCKLNYELNNKNNYSLKCVNSLENFSEGISSYDYVVMNPPFGSSTVVSESRILNNFELGKNRKKQEIGILFIELGLKLLKNNGILFVIIPSGYVGNSTKQCVELRELLLKNIVIASIELPKNTFKRSGTGVNTYLLIVQKKEIPLIEDYNILISNIENIGYNLTKKETPLKYKINKLTGEFITDENGDKILENDLIECFDKVSSYCFDNNIFEINKTDNLIDYESVLVSELDSYILDIKRYINTYTSVVQKMHINKATTVKNLSKLVSTSTKIDDKKLYKYIDIGEINSPFYTYKELYGWELPSRAKYTLKKYDILISKLEGNLSYCVILDDSSNYISTNGVAVLRPNNMEALYILFNNIMKKDFVIQHNAYLTGSIMASISESDIENILIDDKLIDIEKAKKIIEMLEEFNILRN